jgi:hypothetical protein
MSDRPSLHSRKSTRTLQFRCTALAIYSSRSCRKRCRRSSFVRTRAAGTFLAFDDTGMSWRELVECARQSLITDRNGIPLTKTGKA